jgi:integrase
MRLDAKTVARLPLPEDQGKADVLYWCDDTPGFGLRCRNGRRVWVSQFRIGHLQRRLKIGDARILPPDAARKQAIKILAAAQLGQDPAADRRKNRADDKLRLGALIEEYLDHRLRLVKAGKLRPGTYQPDVRYLKTHWRPLHPTPIAKLDRRQIAAELVRIERQNGDVAAIRARTALSTMFVWALGRGLVESNPTIGTIAPPEPRPRERVLTNDEIACVWSACGDDDYGRIIKLLILTGARRDEIGHLRWSEIDTGTGLWTLPAARAKNHRALALPLPQIALEIIGQVEPRGDHVFGLFGHGFKDWARCKVRLDARIEAARGQPLAPWRVHDLRRTCASGLGDLGILPHVVECVLNHASGFKRGVGGTYNKSVYAAETKQALARWADHLMAIVTGEAHKVVPFKQRAVE